MRLDPVSVEGDMGLRRISQIIRTFVDLNIYHIQFNVVSSEVLRCAQETPEEYKSLIVQGSRIQRIFHRTLQRNAGRHNTQDDTYSLKAI